MNVSSRYLVKVALPEIGRATFGGLVKIYETAQYTDNMILIFILI